MGSNERRTPAGGEPPLLELAVAADLVVALNSVARNLGRLVGDLGKMETSERRLELVKIGRELGELGDTFHEARHVFWDVAGYDTLSRPNRAPDPAAPKLTDSGAHDT